MQFKEFEKQGLKIDRERVLTYSHLSCPLECTYCFVDEMSQAQSRGVSYLTEEQMSLLKDLPEQVKLIMLGCDTEFFQNKKEALEILKRISLLGRDVSVITKIPLSEEYVKSLADINNEMRLKGKVFSFSISLPCISATSLQKFEPKVPSPLKRIETLSLVFNQGIPTTVAIRPLLPDVTNEELKEIVSRTKDFCFGYYSGPLYLQEQKIKLLLPGYESKPETEEQPHWMLDGNRYQAVARDGQMDALKSFIKFEDKLFFEGAADAIEYLRKKYLYEKP